MTHADRRDLDTLRAAAEHAVRALADRACVHGPAFDSNEYPDWDSHCSICAAMRPLVRVLGRFDRPARTVEDR